MIWYTELIVSIFYLGSIIIELFRTLGENSWHSKSLSDKSNLASKIAPTLIEHP
jgi:hypothetical protein